MVRKCCNQYASKFGKLSSGHRTRKSQFSFQSQRKAMPNNSQTTAHLYSSRMLVKECSNCRTIALISHASKVMKGQQSALLPCFLPGRPPGFETHAPY